MALTTQHSRRRLLRHLYTKSYVNSCITKCYSSGPTGFNSRQCDTLLQTSVLRVDDTCTRRKKIPKSGHASTALRLLSSHHQPAKKIFSGIQPTGIPHLGNYLGALSSWVSLQDHCQEGTELFFSVVDLHALTSLEKGQLKQQTKECLAALVAIGLGKKSSIFVQSQVSQHSEMMWILSTTASMGYLSRMTQWKSKLQMSTDASPFEDIRKSNLKLGLFSYPVLQAADILVHRATHVPVGEDQAQHLEFARECATNFNTMYGQNLLVQPQTILAPTKRVMSLTDPSKKMSKSDPAPSSRILLTDTPAEIDSKLRTAVTDSINAVSYDPINRPGVSNLLSILSAFDLESRSAEDLGEKMGGMGLGSFKRHVGEVVGDGLKKVRDEYQRLIADDGEGGGYLTQVAEEGRQRAALSAGHTMQRVRDAIGLS